MKYFEDGNQIVVIFDNFVNLQESPAVFIPKDSEPGKYIQDRQSLLGLPVTHLWAIRDLLAYGGGEYTGGDYIFGWDKGEA